MNDSSDPSILKNFNTVPQVAAFLSISPQTIYREVEAGHMGYVRMSERAIRIRREHVLAYLEANTHEPQRKESA